MEILLSSGLSNPPQSHWVTTQRHRSVIRDGLWENKMLTKPNIFEGLHVEKKL